MKRALTILAAASLLAAAIPALAGYPIGFFDERYPLETNKARFAFPNPPSGETAASKRAQATTQQPYALTGTPRTTPPPDEGWTMSVEWVGRYPQTIYRR